MELIFVIRLFFFSLLFGLICSVMMCFDICVLMVMILCGFRIFVVSMVLEIVLIVIGVVI